ncbi:hypothetical protein LTR36_007469 [Oleoguttula mirabilis]|uniref:Uncharacterized protein n=1 Tax=Oleoguttula mirabilis TaxID=1507867 RepID=A0AAV9JA93_9PEZI|nr:hypothetical protein LTR36_007469 [Oleoguttula mirabilis]
MAHEAAMEHSLVKEKVAYGVLASCGVHVHPKKALQFWSNTAQKLRYDLDCLHNGTATFESVRDTSKIFGPIKKAKDASKIASTWLPESASTTTGTPAVTKIITVTETLSVTITDSGLALPTNAPDAAAHTPTAADSTTVSGSSVSHLLAPDSVSYAVQPTPRQLCHHDMPSYPSSSKSPDSTALPLLYVVLSLLLVIGMIGFFSRRSWNGHRAHLANAKSENAWLAATIAQRDNTLAEQERKQRKVEQEIACTKYIHSFTQTQQDEEIFHLRLDKCELEQEFTVSVLVQNVSWDTMREQQTELAVKDESLSTLQSENAAIGLKLGESEAECSQKHTEIVALRATVERLEKAGKDAKDADAKSQELHKTQLKKIEEQKRIIDGQNKISEKRNKQLSDEKQKSSEQLDEEKQKFRQLENSKRTSEEESGKKIATAEQTCRGLGTQLGEVTEERDGLKADVVESQRKAEDTQTTLTSLVDEIGGLKKQVEEKDAAAEECKRTSDAMCDGLKKQVDSLKEHVQEKDSTIAETERSTEESRAKLQGEIDGLKEEDARKDNDIAATERSARAAKTEHDELVEGLQTEYADLRTALVDANGKLEKPQAQCDEAGKIGELKTSLEEALTSKDERIGTLEDENRSLETRLGESDEKVKTAERQHVQDRARTVSAVKKSALETERQSADKLKSSTDENERLETELRTAQASKSTADLRVTSLSDTLKVAVETMELKDGSITTLERSRDEAGEFSVTLLADIKRQADEIKDLKEDLGAVQGEKEKLQTWRKANEGPANQYDELAKSFKQSERMCEQLVKLKGIDFSCLAQVSLAKTELSEKLQSQLGAAGMNQLGADMETGMAITRFTNLQKQLGNLQSQLTIATTKVDDVEAALSKCTCGAAPLPENDSDEDFTDKHGSDGGERSPDGQGSSDSGYGENAESSQGSASSAPASPGQGSSSDMGSALSPAVKEEGGRDGDGETCSAEPAVDGDDMGCESLHDSGSGESSGSGSGEVEHGSGEADAEVEVERHGPHGVSDFAHEEPEDAQKEEEDVVQASELSKDTEPQTQPCTGPTPCGSDGADVESDGSCGLGDSAHEEPEDAQKEEEDDVQASELPSDTEPQTQPSPGPTPWSNRLLEINQSASDLQTQSKPGPTLHPSRKLDVNQAASDLARKRHNLQLSIEKANYDLSICKKKSKTPAILSAQAGSSVPAAPSNSTGAASGLPKPSPTPAQSADQHSPLAGRLPNPAGPEKGMNASGWAPGGGHRAQASGQSGALATPAQPPGGPQPQPHNSGPSHGTPMNQHSRPWPTSVPPANDNYTFGPPRGMNHGARGNGRPSEQFAGTKSSNSTGGGGAHGGGARGGGARGDSARGSGARGSGARGSGARGGGSYPQNRRAGGRKGPWSPPPPTQSNSEGGYQRY